MLCDTPAKRRRLQRRRPIDQSHRFESYHPSRDGGTGRHGRTRASTSSSPVANEVTVETNARLPMWFARNVRQVCDRLVSRSGRYRDTVRSETMIPSFSNSPWIRGAPQRQFSVAMRPTSFRSCKSMRSRRPPASDASSIHGTLRETNGRPWPSGPAREPPSTGARTVASTPRVDIQSSLDRVIQLT